MLIIGVSGKRRHGKDEVCKIIQRSSTKRVTRFAFADAIKKEVAEACQVTLTELEENKEVYRPILQWWGSWRKATRGEDYWILQLKKTLQAANNFKRADIAVVTDVRFPNEVDMLKGFDAKVVRVNRPPLTATTAVDEHPSETALDNWHFDYTIRNDGSLEDLEARVATLLDGILFSQSREVGK